MSSDKYTLNSGFKKYINVIYECFADILCPKKCIMCDKMIDIGTKVSICKKCRAEISSSGRVIGDSETTYKEAVASVVYDGNVRNAMMRYKFNGMKYLHSTFSWLILEKIKNRKFMECIDVICPVPIHPMRNREYNQSALIARDISEFFEIPLIEDLILKIRHIKPLSTMSFRQRRIFIRDSMTFNTDYDITGKTVLLVDDTMTTGATLFECSRILKLYGAADVYAAAACYVKKDENDEKDDEEMANDGGLISYADADKLTD